MHMLVLKNTLIETKNVINCLESTISTGFGNRSRVNRKYPDTSTSEEWCKTQKEESKPHKIRDKV